jgi:hypothetical protein
MTPIWLRAAWHQLLSPRFVWVWGSPPLFWAGLSEELTSPSGSCFGRPMGTYLPFTGGAKSRGICESGFGWEHLWMWIARVGGGSHRGPGLVWGGA